MGKREADHVKTMRNIGGSSKVEEGVVLLLIGGGGCDELRRLRRDPMEECVSCGGFWAMVLGGSGEES